MPTAYEVDSWLLQIARLIHMICVTLISLTKNLVYKNTEAEMTKKIRTIIRTLSASQ